MGADGAANDRTTDRAEEEAILEEVRAALRAIRFGSVLIKIHDGEVVAIETSTKVRLKGGTKPV